MIPIILPFGSAISAGGNQWDVSRTWCQFRSFTGTPYRMPELGCHLRRGRFLLNQSAIIS